MRRALLACCGAVMVLALTLAPIHAASPSVRLDAVPTTASTLAVKGTVTSRAVSAAASLQVKLSSGWSTLATTRVSPTGRLSFSAVPTTGRTAYRVQVAKTRRTAVLTSRTFTVTGTPRITPDLPVLAERTTVGGRVPSTGARDVVLQERTATGWVEVARARAGSTGLFTVSFVAESARLRVQAPQVRSGRVVKPTWTSSEIALAPPRQTGTLRSLKPSVVGERATFRATFSPARPGRAVQLREQRGDAWVVVATGRQATSGNADLGFVPSRPATLQLRATSSGDDVLVHGTLALTVHTTDAPSSGSAFPDATAPVTRLEIAGSDARLTATPVAQSDDGRYLLFSGGPALTTTGEIAADARRLHLYDRTTGSTRMIGAAADGTPPRFGATSGSMSADGRWVAFQATMDLLGTSGDRATAVMLWDRTTGEIRRITRSDSRAPRISADGRHVVYQSRTLRRGDPISPLWRWSRETGQEELVTRAEAGTAFSAGTSFAVSGDGRFVAYEARGGSAAEGRDDVVVLWDGADGRTELVSRRAGGAPGSGDTVTMSRDGGFVGYSSRDAWLFGRPHETISTLPPHRSSERAHNDVYLWDRATKGITLVSAELSNAETHSTSGHRLSADGRFVYYGTNRSALFDSPSSRAPHQLVRWDRVSGERILISRAADGTPADGGGHLALVSLDGRRLLMSSSSTNLVPEDPERDTDLFVVSPDWTEESGRRGGYPDLDLAAPVPWSHATVPLTDPGHTLVSHRRDGTPATQGAGGVSIAADGRYITFSSSDSELDPDDQEPEDFPREFRGNVDVFTWDRQTDLIDRISVGLGGAPTDHQSYGAVSSADGRWVAYVSEASNLVAGDVKGGVNSDIFLWDRVTGTTKIVTSLPSPDRDDGNSPLRVAMSPDGNHLAFWSDVPLTGPRRLPQFTERLYVWDRRTEELTWLRLDTPGELGRTDPDMGRSPDTVAISNGGSHVAFVREREVMEQSATSGTIDEIFVWEVATGDYEAISRPTGGARSDADSGAPSISADGRYVSFSSDATNLVPGDLNGETDVFVWDSRTRGITMISRAPDGAPSYGQAGGPRMSHDGSTVVFTSTAHDLSPLDDNRVDDAFVWRRETGVTTLLSRSTTGGAVWGSANTGSGAGASGVSSDGRVVAFSSAARVLGYAATRGAVQVFLARE